MNKQITIFSLVLMFSLIVISAQTYEQDELFDLKIPFEVNGSIPSSAAWCNVSIQYPNGTYLKNNNGTTNLGNGEFNITLNSTEMNTIGEYKWVASCCDAGQCARGYDTFDITRTGKETPDSMPVLFAVIIIIVFGTAWFFLFLSLKIEEPGPKLFFMLASLIFLIGAIGLGMVFAEDNNVTENVSNLVGNLLWVLGIIFTVMFFYIFIRQTVQALTLLRVKKGLSMGVGGYNPRGAY